MADVNSNGGRRKTMQLRCFLLFSYELHVLPVIRHILTAVQTDNVSPWLAGNAFTVANWLESSRKTVVGVDTTEQGVHYLGEHGELQRKQDSRSILQFPKFSKSQIAYFLP